MTGRSVWEPAMTKAGIRSANGVRRSSGEKGSIERVLEGTQLEASADAIRLCPSLTVLLHVSSRSAIPRVGQAEGHVAGLRYATYLSDGVSQGQMRRSGTCCGSLNPSATSLGLIQLDLVCISLNPDLSVNLEPL